MTDQMTNPEFAELLAQFADLLDIKGESGFRVNAYRRAADTVKRLDEPIPDLVSEGRLTDVKGIGKGIAASLTAIAETGRFEELEELLDEIPATLLTILAIPGVGPKTVGRLYRELAITNIDDLEHATNDGLVRELKGMGKKQEERILTGIAFLRERTGRMSIGSAYPAAKEISRALAESLGTRVEIAGSVRRMCETVGNLDLLIADADLDRAAAVLQEVFNTADGAEVEDDVLGARIPTLGEIRVVSAPADRFGTELVRLTGSTEHVEHLAALANPLPNVSTEGDLYEELGLPWIPPELRESRGEVDAALTGTLPDLLELDQIRGDLHLHSTWSDGRASLRELADRANELGYAFLSIADHSYGLAIANGLDESRLRQQWEAIAAVNEDTDGVRLLRASEVEIRRDGSLDFPDEVLAELDLVVASMHSGRSLPREELTARLIRAIENPHVDIIAHPTGRIIEQRPRADLDWEKVFKAAARTRTALEINANPARLDLPEELAKEAVEAGVLIAVDSDAHDLSGLDVMRYGVGIARRAWVPRDRVINTWTLNDLLEWLRR